MGRLIKYSLLLSLALLSMQGHAASETRDSQANRHATQEDAFRVNHHNDENQTQALQLRQAGKILPLEQILQISRQEINGDILEVKLEQDDDQANMPFIYELEILDRQGQVWELKIDAQNGQIIEREQE